MSYKKSVRASIQDGNNHAFCHEASAGVKSDSFGASAEAKYNSSLYRYCDDVGDLKLLNAGVGAKAAANTIDGLKAKVEARCDLVDLEVGGFKSKFGISADTGGSIGSNGVEAKVAGIGFKFGKEMGISLPFGEISFDLGKLF
ncbi:uncharacterized protein OCT59_001737 [Rhizophagus irregularis]|uniref:Uncharacterized protein n=2 Tax=Rhizophagus irregularis TaxID=588596 RepID=A0A015IJ27_RHIIW|nr:hypothetical protein GLOIN_2v1515995 [Rhizophagus irregularis DAOM 181602=DAOM 197198]EXX54100.1 hypothetical protein RirG_237710 [Rhizophagus irregularis DAOM 197198w]UZO10139.1 hypothetical protein OCT59_001737 [Rhizophagus irregularis]POG80512.1 hypothetical protein GLOIN_2v1515995 [Rhizophagus irregularis DAOM 181602=DAOM 197198]CAG8715953.1 13722_t:CDS:1 [Rhizophagus irregularis]GBC41236.1 hypothetical protein GLOIN_2v1515995 [Rhizophagus irregularis DAOM 181602=DAOM 197198]|eukprot:XP_025187378.1 hypothetical protein GLOIN_2v1515995 [Rhizophagus irregularis DAOM 181602=DAOM 197198]